MRALEATATLATFDRRGPGTDSERRAARRLARDLSGLSERATEDPNDLSGLSGLSDPSDPSDPNDPSAQGYKVTTEPFWGRPNWALAHAWHVALALAGSLVSVGHPTLARHCSALALVSVLADGLTGLSPGRRLTPERASQNVVARRRARCRPPTPTRPLDDPDREVRRPAEPRSSNARAPPAGGNDETPTGPLALGWLAWLSIPSPGRWPSRSSAPPATTPRTRSA